MGGDLAGAVVDGGWYTCREVLSWFVVKCEEEMFAGYCEAIEGRREGREQGFIGRGKGRREVVIGYLTRPAIGSLQVFHHIHAHASRHRARRIATFGSFSKQYRGVLANRKRRLLGRAPVGGRRAQRRNCHPSSFFTPAAERSYHSNT